MIIKKKSLKKQGFGLMFLLSITLTWNVGVWGEEFSSDDIGNVGGGSGGTRNYNLDCGANGIMTGAMAKSRSYLDQLLVICRHVNPSTGALGHEFTRGPTGGMGGRDEIRRCQDGRVVTRLLITGGRFIHGLVFGCEEWFADRRQPLQVPGPIIEVDRFGFGFTVCGISDPSCETSTFRCPGFRVAKALRGRSGIYIDSFRMVCDDWDQ